MKLSLSLSLQKAGSTLAPALSNEMFSEILRASKSLNSMTEIS